MCTLRVTQSLAEEVWGGCSSGEGKAQGPTRWTKEQL